jgi:iron complex transport system ATP-binding protein
LRPADGQVIVGEADVWRLSPRAAAIRTAVVAQERSPDFEFSVRDIVAMGRTPHKGLLERDGPQDREIVEAALVDVGLEHLGGRIFSSLSGGEKQKVLVARALAQRSPVLVLDEPTNHLDVHAQLDLMELVRRLQVTVIAALHDLNLAARYCDRLLLMKSGRLVAAGTVEQVLTPDHLAAVFKVEAHCGIHPTTGDFIVHLRPLPAMGSVES